MQMNQVLVLLLAGAAAGFGGYCITCALHVWRKRNHRSSPHDPVARQLGRAARTLLLLAGFACMSVALLAPLLFQRRGLLKGEDLITVRVPKDLQVVWTTQEEMIERGDVLVRFYSPERCPV